MTQLTVSCGACGNPAGSVTLIDQRPSGARRLLARLFPSRRQQSLVSAAWALRISGFIGVEDWAVGSDAAPRIEQALRAGDVKALYAMHPLWAPFYCPDCDRCYCANHWRSLAHYDEGFFDYTEA